MKETIYYDPPQELLDMSEDELFEFLQKQNAEFQRHVSEVCMRGGVPEYSRKAVIEQLAEKFEMRPYGGLWIKIVRVDVLPSIFKNVIDKHVKKRIKEDQKSSEKKV